MANATGVSNYVFPEDRQAAEDALTEKLYEYALQSPRASAMGMLTNPGYEMNAAARAIQYANTQNGERYRKQAEDEQGVYLKYGQKWLAQERRRKNDAELLEAIKNDPVFRRRLMTLQNPETFNDSFWVGQ